MKKAASPRKAVNSSEPKVPDLETFLPHRLAILSRLTQSRLAAILEASDITIAQWRVYLCLVQNGPSTLNAIAEFTQLPQSSLSRSVAKMHERGLVINNRDESDRRLAKIAITKAGRRQLDAAVAAIDANWEKALSLSRDELDALLSTVNRLIEHLSNDTASR